MSVHNVYGLGSHIGSHIKIINMKLFFVLFEILEKDIFVILIVYIDLSTIFELITILSVNYGNHILLMTLSGGVSIICFSQNYNFIIRICRCSGICRKILTV